MALQIRPWRLLKEFGFYFKCNGKPVDNFNRKVIFTNLYFKLTLWLLCKGWKQGHHLACWSSHLGKT